MSENAVANWGDPEHERQRMQDSIEQYRREAREAEEALALRLDEIMQLKRDYVSMIQLHNACQAHNKTISEGQLKQSLELRRYRKALEFYANPDIYKPHPHGPAFDRRDLSFHAREALEPYDPTAQPYDEPIPAA